MVEGRIQVGRSFQIPETHGRNTYTIEEIGGDPNGFDLKCSETDWTGQATYTICFFSIKCLKEYGDSVIYE